MKRIPKRFQMGPHTVEVSIVSQAEMHKLWEEWEKGTEEDAPYGLCVFTESRIYVQAVRKGLPKQLQLHTFWHEYFHMLFYQAGRERLSRDEVLVDMCGGLHLQAMQSAVH